MQDFKYLGHCHVVGLILHRLLGYRLCVFYGFRNEGKQRVLVHVGVVDENFHFIDEKGSWGKAPSEVRAYLRAHNPPYDSLRYFILTEKSPRWKVILKRTNAEKVSFFKFQEIKRWVRASLIPYLKDQGVRTCPLVKA